MNYEEEIIKLQKQVSSLQRCFSQDQRNQVKTTSRTDQAFNKIPQVDDNTTNITTNTEDIVETQVGLAETYEETNNGITQCEIAITEIYEMLMPPETAEEEE